MTRNIDSTKSDHQEGGSLQDLFEEQVARYADATAVVFEDERLTYRELNVKANQLAHYLRTLGVGPDTLVGLHVNRSLEMAVGVVGILKAGAAYVPMDPSYPEERLRFMLSDSRVQVALTEKGLIDSLAVKPAHVVCLDTPSFCTYPTHNPESLAGPRNLAYVIYTSGSTGKPKGVAMEHGPLSNLIHWQTNVEGFKPKARVLQFAPLSFDVSFQEMYSTWCSGGALVVIGESTRKDTAAMLRLMSEARVERLFLPFVALQYLAEAAVDSNEFPQDLREVITAGEQLRITPAVNRFFSELGHCRLHNHYGPTETHVATAYTLPGTSRTWPALPPIGRPIANAKAYILDAQRKPVPVGVAGELYLGGNCVARGYLNRPELTEERFLCDPYSSGNGVLEGRGEHPRMYKTGDLARLRADGNIEFLGRTDDQVKIRGFRVELGEIESALLEIASFKQVAVTAESEEPGTKRLMAYVVASDRSEPDVHEIRAALRAKLPDHMIPSAIILLERMPLTPSGKIDRRSLAGATGVRLDAPASRVAPRNASEQGIAEIFARVLKLASVGVHDNFFDLGGHSLLALKVTSEIEKAFGRRLSVASFYQAPTVEGLSLLISQDVTEVSESLLVPLQPAGSALPFFWVHGEASDPILSRYLGPERPVYGVMHQGHDGRPARHTTVEEIAEHYIEEIRKVQSQGPYLLGGYCFGGIVALEMAQRLKREGQSVPRLVLLDPDTPATIQCSQTNVPPVSRPNGSNAPRLSVRRHLGNLKPLRSKARGAYVFVRLNQKLSALLRGLKIVKLTKAVVTNLYFQFDRPLHPRLRSDYILGVYRRALSQYVPQPYDGQMIVLKAADSSSDAEPWAALARGGLDVFEVPGDHIAVLQESSVKIWAARVSSWLRETRIAGIIASAYTSATSFDIAADGIQLVCFVLETL